jgi:primosomal protein N' (replication factor Y)
MPDAAPTLFGPADPPPARVATPRKGPTGPPPEGPFASVAIEQSVDRSLDYAIPPRLVPLVKIGQRVRVPLGRGNKPTHGYVVTVRQTTDYPNPHKIKSLLAIDDQRVLVPPTLMELAVWMAKYYVTPLGGVLDCIIPSAVKKRTGIGYVSMVRLALPRDQAQELLEKTTTSKRRAVLARLLEVEDDQPIELLRLAREAGVKPPTVRKLSRVGVITVTSQVDLPALTADMDPSEASQPDTPLNEDQQKVFDDLLPRLLPPRRPTALPPRNQPVTAPGEHDSPRIAVVARAKDAVAPPRDVFTSPGDGFASPGDGFASSNEVSAPPKEMSAPPEEVSAARNEPGAPSAKPGFSVNLLMGVTGSGKTEVYLQALRKVVEQGRQAIVLVPEIALTPQTVRRFTARFPRVAILHSGLSATQRHKYWQQIATGQAQVVVGARSAVFAPVPNLGAIVVDEEHESSYKQDQAPRYHGRDVAIKRAQLEDVPVILGSATPSLEMYAKVKAEGGRGGARQPESPGAPPRAAGGQDRSGRDGPTGSRSSLRSPDAELPAPARGGAPGLSQGNPPPAPASPYHLLVLPRRVRGLSLPHVELIDMKQEARLRRGVNLFSQRLEYLLTNTVAQGQQAILLLNRRGYSNYIYCPSCQHVMGCKYCDKTMTYHRSAGEHALTAANVASAHSGQLHCHYCLAVNVLPTACPQCKKHLSLFGLGTQRVEEEVKKKFPHITFARVDSDTMRSSRDYEALLGRFARREVQVMLGTQMIAKGLDYPNVTLVGVISGDTALALPDFRAAERTFQLITQVAGRAGRGDLPGRVVLQTFIPDDPAIQAAIKQDFVGFADRELVSRREVGLPPFGRMVRIVLREEDDAKLQRMSEELAADLAAAAALENGAVTIKGPMPCAVGRISGYFRYQIILSAATPAPLQRVLAGVREKGRLTRGERVAVDVDPVSLL